MDLKYICCEGVTGFISVRTGDMTSSNEQGSAHSGYVKCDLFRERTE